MGRYILLDAIDGGNLSRACVLGVDAQGVSLDPEAVVAGAQVIDARAVRDVGGAVGGMPSSIIAVGEHDVGQLDLAIAGQGIVGTHGQGDDRLILVEALLA